MITNKINIGQNNNVTRAVARFGMGQVVVHKLLHTRGVIIDIDPVFLGSEAGYDEFAQNRPAKDQPWYKVLVNNAHDESYLPEQNLTADSSDEQIKHPLLEIYFDEFNKGHYKNTSWRLN